MTTESLVWHNECIRCSKLNPSISGPYLFRLLYNQCSASQWPGTPLPLAGSVSWGSSPCVDVSSDEVPPSCCVMLISTYKLVFEFSTHHHSQGRRSGPL